MWEKLSGISESVSVNPNAQISVHMIIERLTFTLTGNNFFCTGNHGKSSFTRLENCENLYFSHWETTFYKDQHPLLFCCFRKSLCVCGLALNECYFQWVPRDAKIFKMWGNKVIRTISYMFKVISKETRIYGEFVWSSWTLYDVFYTCNLNQSPRIASSVLLRLNMYMVAR